MPVTASLADFAQRLTALRKQKDLMHQQVADRTQTHVQQLKPYEAGSSQPTLDTIRKLAVALSVSADMLLFEDQERAPDEDLKPHFEAVTRLDPEEKKVIRSVIESIILRHEARRWSASGTEK